MLDDDWRWKIYTYMLAAGSPPPHESVLVRAEAARILLPLCRAVDRRDHRRRSVTVKTARAVERFDAVLFGTGFDVDLSRVSPSSRAFASNIRLWSDMPRRRPKPIPRRPAAPISARASS